MVAAKIVKELREKTGAGMMDCKKALTETNGDLNLAVDWLRAKGLSAAAKKASRSASDGLVCVLSEDNKAGIIEVNSETDFVARNDLLQEFVLNLGQMVVDGEDNLDSLSSANYAGSEKIVSDKLTQMIATIGENIAIRRIDRLDVSRGVVCKYIHNSVKPNLGKIGVILAIETEAEKGQIEELGKQLTMHIAASNPLSISKDDLDKDILEREKNILIEQASESGRPADIIEKMVEGRLRKYYQEVCLLEQTFVIDNETRVSSVINKYSTEVKQEINIKGFFRYQLGELNS